MTSPNSSNSFLNSDQQQQPPPSSIQQNNNNQNSSTINNNSSSNNNNNNNNTTSFSKIIDAARKGNIELVQKFLKKDWKKVNKRDERGDTCLHKAALFGHADCIEFILRWCSHNGLLLQNQMMVNINAKNNDNFTPLMYASLNGWKECIKVLLNYGADVNEKLPNNPGVPLSYSINNSNGIYTWRIENFNKIKERKIYSNTFLVNGYSWKLVAYPKGSKSDDNLSLYLEVANHESLGEGWDHLVNFTFTITNHLDSKKNITRDVQAHRFHKHHTDLGFSQILKKEMLKDKKSGWLLNDSLLIEFKIEIIPSSTNSFISEDAWQIYSWKIQKVSSMKERATSPVFTVGNCKWMVALYLRGKNGGNNLSIYLKVADSTLLPLDWFYLVNFKFSIINQLDGSKFTRQVEGKNFKSSVEDWGFPQFMKLTMLHDQKNGYINFEDDSIIVELQMEIINDFSKKKLKDNISDWGLTLLHWFTYKGSYDYIRFLLLNGANVNVIDSRGRSPLHWAAYNGDLPAADILITTGMADVNCKDLEGYTPLHKAVMNGHSEVANLLFKYGASLNAKNNQRVSPLSLAIRVNRMWCVESLIKCGADLNITDKNNRSPLHWAVIQNDSVLLALLLKYGGSQNSLPQNQYNQQQQQQQQQQIRQFQRQQPQREELALTEDIAVGSDTNDLSELELQHNNQTESYKHLGSYHSASTQSNSSRDDIDSDSNDLDDQEEYDDEMENKLEMFYENMRREKDCQQQQEQQQNSENILPNTKPKYVMKVLAKNNSNNNILINSQNNNNNNNNNNQILQINIKDQYGETPLHLAILKGNIGFVKILLKKGADPSICNKDKRNALHLAVMVNEVAIAELLLDHQPYGLIDQFDSKGYTPLHKCVLVGNLVMLDLLVTRGADVNCHVNLPVETTSSPLSDALKNNDVSCIIYLLKKNSNINKNPKSLMNLLSKQLKALKPIRIDQLQCTLSSDMKYLLNNQNYSDVTFVVEDKPIYAWKGILCARSVYFKAMFEVPLKESIENIVKMESISYSTFLLLLEYLYTGNVDSLFGDNFIQQQQQNNQNNNININNNNNNNNNTNSNNNAINNNNKSSSNTTDNQNKLEESMMLFIASNRFMVNRLLLLCEQTIIKYITIDNIYSIYKLADLHDSSILLNECVKFIVDNYYLIAETDEIVKTDSFRMSVLEYLDQILQQQQQQLLINNYTNTTLNNN